MRQAFIASATLKPMALQLLQNRTPAAYAGVEAYARHHEKEDAGALAWLVLGYAHILDSDFAKAIDPLKRALPSAGDLGDYVAFYLGTAYFHTGGIAEAISTFSKFDDTYPKSLLLRDAHLTYANALLANGDAKQAAALLENDRRPVRSDFELTLGKSYEAAGNSAKALAIFRTIYFTMPLSPEAGAAQAEMNKLAVAANFTPTFEERRTRADLLLKGRHYDDAAQEYRDLLPTTPASEVPSLNLKLAGAWLHMGHDKDAKKILDELKVIPPELQAERLYDLAEIARDADDETEFSNLIENLRIIAPTSHWLEQALLTGGNLYLLKPDYDKAIDYFREINERFPRGNLAAYSHWKVAWLSLRQGRNVEAKKGFEEQIALYPASGQVSAALYWRGRLAEEDNDPAMASAYYLKLSERFRNYYYGVLARERMANIRSTAAPAHLALLDHVPPLNFQEIADDPIPADDLRIQKAELLANGALIDFAVNELQAAASEEGGTWLPAETARLYQDNGRYDRAIQTLKHAVPSYFSLDLPNLPRSYWEALFPKAYWPDLKKYAAANGLDPYLVASLIRQESEFNPDAVSSANALGLMQLLPSVGKGVARQVRMPHFSSQELFTPAVNLQLGTRYFRSMVDKFGAFEYALAAYNAGDSRVQAWMGYGKYRDIAEFVESIPFTQTREYVQAIMRNAYVYRQIYGTP